FLVTLRNLGRQQKAVWQNSTLITILSHQLHSIQPPTTHLQKQAMPLHPPSLFNNFTNEIQNTTFEKLDQIILLHNLNNL
uniref:hypothetical protein n=1 Tax=Priestia megaterium TaxID=1404 RepID=UPI001C99A025